MVESPPFQTLQLFKGIALFTPGGDLVYAIDPTKQSYWHLHLCGALQRALSLSEPPHFLTPCHTATVDRWQHPQTREIHTTAELYPAVLRHQALLNVLFGLSQEQVWQIAPMAMERCDPLLMEAYRTGFPQLWQEHDLLLKVERTEPELLPQPTVSPPAQEARGYELRLFVSGHSLATERTLQALYRALEQLLHQAYSLKIVDVLKHPEEAEADHVSATPTLLKVWPLPSRRLVGNLENLGRLFDPSELL